MFGKKKKTAKTSSTTRKTKTTTSKKRSTSKSAAKTARPRAKTATAASKVRRANNLRRKANNSARTAQRLANTAKKRNNSKDTSRFLSADHAASVAYDNYRRYLNNNFDSDEIRNGSGEYLRSRAFINNLRRRNSSARLSKVRRTKGQPRSSSPTYTVTVYGESTGRKTFATPQEAQIYAQRLANRKGKNTVILPGNFPVTHRYNLK